MLTSFLFAACLTLFGCDPVESEPRGLFPFSPDTLDFDQIQLIDYSDYVQPLLAHRNVFAPVVGTGPGLLGDYEWADIFDSTWGETIVPFDADGSLFIRFIEDLPGDAEIPYPNLRNLEEDEIRYLKRWIEAGAVNDDGEIPFADSEHLLYAAVQGANYVAIIDASRRQIIRNIYFADHGFECAPNGPHYMVFEPDRSAVYVSLVNCNTVAKISGSLTMDPSDEAYFLGATRSFTTPGMMALDTNTNRLYVGRSTASLPSTTPTIGVFDSENLDGEPIEYPIPEAGTSFPHALGLSPDGRFLLTAPLTGQDAYSFDAMTGDIISRVSLGGVSELVHFSILPGGTSATLTANPADGSADKVLFFSIDEEGTLELTGSIATDGERAWHAHLDSDGETVLVPNRASNSVSLINVPTETIRLVVENPSDNGPIVLPHSPGPTHAGAFFVSNSNLNGMWTPPYPFLDGSGNPLPNDAFGNVAALDPETGELLKVLTLGHYPSGLEHWHQGGHHHGMQQVDPEHNDHQHEEHQHDEHDH
ncbi:MAG: hypothetical protein R3284_05280 [Rubricoccaceae bacterium]|nr:hypothetical protein [Rubricoccaceae bacterium]